MRKYKLLLTSVVLIWTAIINVSCGKNNMTNSETREYVPSDEYTYDQVEVSLSGVKYEVSNYLINNNYVYVIADEHSDGECKNHVYKADINNLNATEINCELKENEEIYWFCVGNNGEVYYITNLSGKNILYKMVVSDEDKNPDKNVSLQGESSKISIFLEEVLKENDDLVDIVSNTKGELLLLCKDKLYILDQDLIPINECAYGEYGYLYDVAVDKTGDIIGAFSEKTTEAKTNVIKYSAENNTWVEMYHLDTIENDVLMDAESDGEYDLYIKLEDGIYGYRENDKESVKIIDFSQSCITKEEAGMISALSNGKFIGLSYDIGFYFLENNPESNINKEQIILACSDTNIINEAIRFNRSNDKYRIVIRDYSEYDNPEERLSIDIAAGNAPDLVEFNQDLLEGGYIADLSDYYSESNLEKELLEPILHRMKKEGKFYYVAPFFDSFIYVVKEDNYNKINSLKAGELIDYLNENKMEFQLGADSLSTLAYLSNVGSDFINYDKKTCDFAGDDFKKLLEYSKRYGAEEEELYEYEEIQRERISQFREGKILLVPCFDFSPELIQYYKQLYGEDIVFTGKFANVGNSDMITFPVCLSICEASDNKGVCWEFLQILMEKEFQAINCSSYNPVRKDAMEHKYQNIKSSESFTDEYGVEVEPLSGEYNSFGYDVVRKPVQDEDVLVYKQYLESIDQDDYIGIDNQVTEILVEETGEYFSGKIKLEKCVDRIQKRIKVYLNE